MSDMVRVEVKPYSCFHCLHWRSYRDINKDPRFSQDFGVCSDSGTNMWHFDKCYRPKFPPGWPPDGDNLLPDCRGCDCP